MKTLIAALVAVSACNSAFVQEIPALAVARRSTPASGSDVSDWIDERLAALTQGGTIYLPAGEYTISRQIRIQTSGVTLRGDSPFSTRLVAAPGSALESMIRVDGYPWAACYGSTIADLSLEGEADTLRGIHIVKGNNHRLSNVHIDNVAGTGLVLGADPDADTIQQFSSRDLVINGRAGSTGIYADQGASENGEFWQTYIRCNTPPDRLGRAIEIVSGHYEFRGLNTTNGPIGSHAIVTGAPIGISDWDSEDPMPIKFTPVGHDRGSVISRVDLRSCNAVAGEYDVHWQALGDASLTLIGVRMDELDGTDHVPSVFAGSASGVTAIGVTGATFAVPSSPAGKLATISNGAMTLNEALVIHNRYGDEVFRAP